MSTNHSTVALHLLFIFFFCNYCIFFQLCPKVHHCMFNSTEKLYFQSFFPIRMSNSMGNLAVDP